MIGGLCTYIVINISVWFIEKASFGRLTVDKTQKEPWSGQYLSGSGILPPWIKRIAAKVTGRVPGDDLPKNGVYEMGNVRNSDQETRVSLSSQDDDIITVASAK
jgi:AGZA family xanthine/uracil permease-like MFS transporter